VEKHKSFQKTPLKVWKPKASTPNGKQSTKLITKAENESGWRRQQSKVQTVKPAWLLDTWVGTMIEYTSKEVLRENLLREGLGSIRARYLGDKAVLLTGNDGTHLKDVIEANKEVLATVFEALEPWSEKPLCGNRVVWVRCRGLPLHLWTLECFQQATGIVGSLIQVDEATIEWEKLEFARLKVKIPVPNKTEVSKRIMINGVLARDRSASTSNSVFKRPFLAALMTPTFLQVFDYTQSWRESCIHSDAQVSGSE